MSLLVIAVTACDRKETAAPPVVQIEDAAQATDAASPPDAREVDRPIATKIVAAGDTTCAVMSDTTVRCWGKNDHGQLGDGTTTDSPTPVRPEIRSVQDLRLADGTVCALLDDGSVACWGRIAWTGASRDALRPSGVLSVTGVKRLFVFTGRACARIANDSLVCWGAVDARGHFTSPGIAQSRQPTPVAGMRAVIELSPMAAVRDDGSVWSWSGSGAPKRRGLDHVRQLGEREGAICGLVAGGDVQCVGSTLPCAPKPVEVKPSPIPAKPARKPAKGKKPAKTEPVKPGKSVKPVERVEPVKLPVPVLDTKPPEATLTLTLPKASALVFDHGWCVVTALGGRVQCGDGCGKLDDPWRHLERIVEVVGRCARIRGDTVKCWGPEETRAAVETVEGVNGVTSLAIGRLHGCALLARGVITCWGENGHGQLGRGDLEPHPNAAIVPL